MAAGLTTSTQPAAAQQGFGNFFTYQGARKKRVVRKRHAPAAEDTTVAKGDAPKKEGKKEAEQGGQARRSDRSRLCRHLDRRPAHLRLRRPAPSPAHSRVSTGMPGHPTPVGLFSVIGKEPLAPFQHLFRRTDALDAAHHLVGRRHAFGRRPGLSRLARLHPASRRVCSAALGNMTKMGARVVVASPRTTQPFEIANAFLPLPKMQAAPGDAGRQSTGGGSRRLGRARQHGRHDH